jgi:hypothetical protein
MDVFFGEVCLKNSFQIFALIKSSRLLSRGSSLIQAKVISGIYDLLGDIAYPLEQILAKSTHIK